MSGDVQPKKRRDKKKKKDDGAEDIPHKQFHMPPTINLDKDNDDVNIHVQKDSHTGGGYCAKFVFFILLAILAVLIGLIITEHRGLTDLDTAAETESRFSQIFEGWVDDKADDHDDHHAAIKHDDDHDEGHGDDHDEHDDDHDDHDEEDEHDDEDDHEDEHSEEEEEEEEEEEHEDEETAASEDAEEEEEYASEVDENSLQQDEEDDEEDDDDDEVDETPGDVSEEPEESEQDQGDSDNKDDDEQEDSEPANEEDEEEDDDQSVQEQDLSEELETADFTNGDDSEEADDKDQSVENANESEEDGNGDKNVEADTEDGDDDEEPTDGEEQNEDDATSGVTARWGVGVAILVVAYIVLVRKWKAEKPTDEPKIEKATTEIRDLSRRNTIVVPPKVEVIEQVFVNPADEEYSDEEEEYSDEDDEDIDEPVQQQAHVIKDYRELQKTYERSLSPENVSAAKPTDDYEEEYEDEEEEMEDEGDNGDGDGEEEELEEEEEIVDENEYELEYEDEEEDDIESESALMKKLEEKYGKLITTPDTGEEEYEDEEDDEEIDEGEQDVDEEDDEDYELEEDTIKTPNWKQGKLAASSETQQITTPQSEAKSSGGPEEVENVASDFDNLLTGALDTAFDYLNNNVVFALNEFNKILENHPKSPRALYGKARALDSLAEQKRSNKHLQEAVQYYTKVLHAEEVTNALYILAAERCINRIRFLGDYKKTITIHKMLIDRFSTDVKYYNQLAITYLTMNFMNEAREILLDVLTKWPNNGVALVHYGFILKVNDDNLIEAIDYLRRGIKSGEDGVIDGRFYFHLGDALTRLGHKDQAQEIYMDGVSKHIFLSTYQRSLYNVDRLTGQPWWHVDQLPAAYQRQLTQFEAHYADIRREALAALQPTGTAASLYRDEAENLRAAGHWQQFELYTRGRRHPANCERCPVTCRLVAGWTDAAGCRRGQVKFSVMKPGTKVWPHCGPTNCRLRAHLGLKVPGGTYLRVAEEIRSWEEGKFLIFDDSFEHEVWHNGTDFRLVLIVDIWHPELTSAEKQTLTAI